MTEGVFMTRTRFALPAVLLALALLGLLALAGCRSAHTTSAILYIEEQQYQKAVDVIHEGFRYRDDEPDAFYWLGEAYSKLAEESVRENDYAEAKHYYELAHEAFMRALELAPDELGELVETALLYNYSSRSNQAKLDYQAGYFEQAEGHFRLAYAALPDSVAPIKNIAGMKMQQAAAAENETERRALYNEALELLDRVLAENPGAYLLKADKASVLTQLGRSEEAQAIYDDLLREHADDPTLLMDVARLSLRKQDYGRAAELYVEVADIYANDTDPENDSEIKKLLFDAGTWFGLQSVGRYEEAIDALNRAAELEVIAPTEDLMLTRLQTYYQYGKSLQTEAAAATDPARKAELTSRAAEQFQRGVEVGNALTGLYVNNADGYLFLSLCQLELGDFQAAQLNQRKHEELSTEGATP
jgi:tetratricopeptide (TPR) repeat protein